jgi:hypothetical protein
LREGKEKERALSTLERERVTAMLAKAMVKEKATAMVAKAMAKGKVTTMSAKAMTKEKAREVLLERDSPTTFSILTTIFSVMNRHQLLSDQGFQQIVQLHR